MFDADIEKKMEIPALEGMTFQPMSPPKVYWEYLKGYNLNPLEEFAGIKIAEYKKEMAEKMKSMEPSQIMRSEPQYFCNDKIEKLTLSWAIIRKSVVAGACMG